MYRLAVNGLYNQSLPIRLSTARQKNGRGKPLILSVGCCTYNLTLLKICANVTGVTGQADNGQRYKPPYRR